MQRWAYAEDSVRISAEEAIQGLDYRCPECGGAVRVRRGPRRRAHFFHRNDGLSCRLRLHDGTHEAVQKWIVDQLGAPSCSCECFFPEISRVADVAFHPSRVVFEVQLSPISPEEAVARTHDYWRIGWHVIWVLHVARYGRVDASLFESALAAIPHYFTDVGFRGGGLFDELSMVVCGKRYWPIVPPQRRILAPLAVETLRSPALGLGAVRPGLVVRSPRQMVDVRRNLWSCHLSGDWLTGELPCSGERSWGRALVRWFSTICQLLWLYGIRR